MSETLELRLSEEVRQTFARVLEGVLTLGVGAAVVAVPVQVLPRVNVVLHDFYEGYSGGRPWVGLGDDDRVIFEDLAAQVRI